MNRLSDIIEMGGNLYEEAWNNGRREALKEVQGGKYEKLEETNRALRMQIDTYETIRRTQDEQIRRYEEQLNMLHEMRQKLEAEHQETAEKLEKAQQENACLSAECDLLDKTAGDLRKRLEDAEAKIEGYEGTSTEASKEIDRLTARVHRYEDENHDLRERLEWVDAKVKEQAEALAIYRVPTPRDCPFCGGPAEVHQLRKDEWYVACGNEDCPVNPETNCFDTETDAIEAWNNSYSAPKVTCDWR